MTGEAATDHVSREHTVESLADAAALWSAGLGAAHEVVDAACAALVAGLDGHWLRMLAAVSTRADSGDAAYEVAEVLEPALNEVGLACHPRFSRAANEAAIRALARRTLRGGTSPWELTNAAHAMFGHEPGLTEELCYLNDVYDYLNVTDTPVEDVNKRVRAEARRLAGG
ncbi:hypothetical protein F4561_005387 [Lipingzhangella halophila]|uniref:Uncharacterized protein n=1 Tax=Lipingzhangella halophila TaxID=1783352 RepID=A0A7W7RMM5_9ACTN|nr:hypothetical protein [Lipingzhangella halophila]MBB4934567.1 hypothetical protein [Lipingzhangella halophila]